MMWKWVSNGSAIRSWRMKRSLCQDEFYDASSEFREPFVSRPQIPVSERADGSTISVSSQASTVPRIMPNVLFERVFQTTYSKPAAIYLTTVFEKLDTQFTKSGDKEPTNPAVPVLAKLLSEHPAKRRRPRRARYASMLCCCGNLYMISGILGIIFWIRLKESRSVSLMPLVVPICCVVARVKRCSRHHFHGIFPFMRPSFFPSRAFSLLISAGHLFYRHHSIFHCLI